MSDNVYLKRMEVAFCGWICFYANKIKKRNSKSNVDQNENKKIMSRAWSRVQISGDDLGSIGFKIAFKQGVKLIAYARTGWKLDFVGVDQCIHIPHW